MCNYKGSYVLLLMHIWSVMVKDKLLNSTTLKLSMLSETFSLSEQVLLINASSVIFKEQSELMHKVIRLTKLLLKKNTHLYIVFTA